MPRTPSAFPFSGRLRRRAINPTPPKRVKAWGEGPLRPEVMYPVVEHTRPNRAARNHSRSRAPHHRTQENARQEHTKGLSCFHGHNCLYRHPPRAQAHVATTEQNISTGGTSSQINEPDFPYGPNEMWWLVYRSSSPTITYLISNNAPHNNPRSSELNSISKELLSWTQRCYTRDARLASYPSLAYQKMLGNAWHVPIPSWKE